MCHSSDTPSMANHHLHTITLLIAIALCISVVGCGSSNIAPVPSFTQNSPQGAVRLFKKELDSNNIKAATKIMAHPSGRLYLAVETYELYDDVARLQRLVAQKAVTAVTRKQNSDTVCSVNLEVGYIKTLSLTTTNIAGSWYITAINE